MGNENVRNGTRNRILFFLLLSAVFLTAGSTAHAFNSFLGTFNTKYGTSATKLDDCITCHTSQGTSTWNPYGQALRSRIGTGISAALTTVEPLDSDGDGHTNLAEITARTFPGNPADFPAPANTAPVAANDSYNVNAGATLTVPAPGVLGNDTDAQGNPLTAALVAGPASGTLNLSSNGSFTYTPTVASGSVSFTYRANDGSLNSNTATVTITINAAPVTLSSIAVTGPSSVNEGSTGAYTATATWSNNSTSNVTSQSSWTTTLGTIGASGVLTAPSVTANQSTTVTASHTSGGVTKTNSVSVTIVNVAVAPTISTSSLPAGTVGTPYSASFAATGGSTPYAWSVASGALPAGLSLSASGTLSGTPTTAVPSATFTVRVTGADGASATKTFTMTINAAAVTGEVTVTPADGEIDVPVNTVVTATAGGTTDIRTIFNSDTFTLKRASAEDDSRESESASGLVCTSNGIVQGTVATNDSLTTATFTPNCPLEHGAEYLATIAADSALAAPDVWRFTTIAGSPDTDEDGVPDNEDDFPRDHGKATPPNPKGHGKYLVEVNGGNGEYLADTMAVSDTSARLNQAGRLVGYEFKDGVISYRIEGVAVGGTVKLDIISPSGIPKGSKVYKADATGFHEYPGAVVNGSKVTLTLTDGGSGDSDNLANGIIVDPVGVASPAASGSGSVDLSTTAASGGCSISGAAGKGGSAAGSYGTLLLLALAMLGVRAAARRIHRR